MESHYLERHGETTRWMTRDHIQTQITHETRCPTSDERRNRLSIKRSDASTSASTPLEYLSNLGCCESPESGGTATSLPMKSVRTATPPSETCEQRKSIPYELKSAARVDGVGSKGQSLWIAADWRVGQFGVGPQPSERPDLTVQRKRERRPARRRQQHLHAETHEERPTCM